MAIEVLTLAHYCCAKSIRCIFENLSHNKFVFAQDLDADPPVYYELRQCKHVTKIMQSPSVSKTDKSDGGAVAEILEAFFREFLQSHNESFQYSYQ